MSAETPVPIKRKRNWREVFGAVGRAHRKAGTQLDELSKRIFRLVM